MDSKQYNDGDDDDGLVFQDLTPETPPNAFQKRILHLQDNWPPHWNKRHIFFLLTALSSLLIFFLIFTFIHPPIQSHGVVIIGTGEITISSSSIITTNVSQMISYGNTVYVIVTQIANHTGTLEELNTQTGKLAWSYPQHTVQSIQMYKNMLYIQTNTKIVAMDADKKMLLWETQIFSGNWQVDQGILFTTSAQGFVTARDAYTGTQLWQAKQPSKSWQVNNGIVYSTPASGSGISVLDAKNGQQLWSNATFNQDWAIDDGNFYLQNNENHSIQAYDSRTGNIRWQFKAEGKDYRLSAHNGFLLLSNLGETRVEAIDGQTGRQLWQRQGILNALTDIPNQTVVSSVQTNETDIIRTLDGTTLHHFTRSDALLSIENNIAFFLHFIQDTNISHPTNNFIIAIEAVNINNGVTIWGNQSRIEFPLLQNNTIGIVPLDSNSLLLLRDDSGHPIWQHIFNTEGN